MFVSKIWGYAKQLRVQELSVSFDKFKLKFFWKLSISKLILLVSSCSMKHFNQLSAIDNLGYEVAGFIMITAYMNLG